MEVELTNFRCWPNKSVRFDDGYVNYLSGRSEAGKSTIFNAVYWCLYDLRNGDPVYNLKKKCGKTIVTVKLTIGSERYVISRSTRPRLFEITIIGSKTVTYKDKEASNIVLSTFGSSEVWRHSCLCSDDHMLSLFESSPKVISNYICGLGFDDRIRPQDIYDAINKSNTQISSDIRLSNVELDNAVNRLQEFEKDTELIHYIDNNGSLSDDLDGDNRVLSKLTRELQDLQYKDNQNKLSIERINTIKSMIDDLNSPCKPELYDLISSLATKQGSYQTLSEQYRIRKKNLDIYDEDLYNCLNQDEKIKSNNLDIVNMMTHNQIVLKDMERCKQLNVGFDNISIRERLELIDRVIAYESNQEKISKLSNEIKDLEIRIQQNNTRITKLTEDRESNEIQILECNIRVKALEQQAIELNDLFVISSGVKCVCPKCDEALLYVVNDHDLILDPHKSEKLDTSKLQANIKESRSKQTQTQRSINNLTLQNDRISHEIVTIEDNITIATKQRDDKLALLNRFTSKYNDDDVTNFNGSISDARTQQSILSIVKVEKLYDINKIKRLKDQTTSRNLLLDTNSISGLDGLDNVLNVIQACKQYDNDINRFNQTLDQLNSRLNSVKLHEIDHNEIQDLKSRIQNLISIITMTPKVHKYRKFTDLKTAIKDRMANLESKLATNASLLAKSKQAEKDQIDNTIKSINFNMNLILKGLFDGDMRVKLSIEKDMSDKSKKHQANFIIYHDNAEMKYSQLSSGAKARVRLAFAVSRNQGKFPFVMIDETVSKLDNNTRSKTLDTIVNYMRQTNKSLIFTCHGYNADNDDNIKIIEL